MGLTKSSIGASLLKKDDALHIYNKEEVKTIALAGNPNVGKSTLFNALTGMNQHTGNWAGKTVSNAKGIYKTKQNVYTLVDIPGTYSLMAHSAEEECARNFICFSDSDAVAVVCDATCLERNMNLCLQIAEISKNTVICVNLMDEAKRKGISLDLKELENRLSMKIVGITAKSKKTLKAFDDALDYTAQHSGSEYKIPYPKEIEMALLLIEPLVYKIAENKISARWLSLRLLCGDKDLIKEASKFLNYDLINDDELNKNLDAAWNGLLLQGIEKKEIGEIIAKSIVFEAQRVTEGIIKEESSKKTNLDTKTDKILSGKYTAYPIMLLLLGFLFWLTIKGANYPSQILSNLFSKLENFLNYIFIYVEAPEFLRGILVDGAYKVSAWVVAVMLPPMAIFFPFFTLLEDLGYLPRIAYNLDKPFKKCSACGKQALTMCMGFGCNAAGVTGCRIIDSKRERLLALLTNSFVPCNGKFPALIAIITMFFAVLKGGKQSSLLAAVILLLFIVLGVAATLFATKILSKTILKGEPSSFTLELPPYRKPKFLEVFVRSVFDRTLFVLGRAVTAAVPAGIILWITANIYVGDKNLLKIAADFLNPIGQFLGLDGVILIAFILGLPANEIVIPIMFMGYNCLNTISEVGNLTALRELFVANGWNEITALCTVVFFLFHWPCATTLLTVKKETGSIKWTLLSFLIPTVIGVSLCAIINFIGNLLVL